jgi:hypothetical protein
VIPDLTDLEKKALQLRYLKALKLLGHADPYELLEAVVWPSDAALEASLAAVQEKAA